MEKCEQGTHHVLVRVHEDVEAIFFRFAQNADGVLYPCLVVLAGPLVLDRLPREDIAYSVVAPGSQTREVSGGIVQRKWPVHKGYIVAVEEVVRYVRREVGCRGELCVGGAVDAMLSNRQSQFTWPSQAEVGAHKNDLAILGVAKGAAVYAQSNG